MKSRTPAVNSDVLEFARLGYRTSLEWTVRITDWPTFTAVMDVVGGYNCFDGHRVARTFEPPFYTAMGIEFGREGSPVMYVDVPFYPNQRIGSDARTGGRYTDEQRREYAALVIDWARRMRADEISVQQFPSPPDNRDVEGKPGPHPYRIRLWWD
ncbi:hypothetical protein ABH933_001219 [Nocardia sp. GP40]|uniref:hypothetical protein n=1 Tax=Nocardia sp. GP40 TaxID=3156268 RepID=UPI003D1FCC72